MNRNMFKRVEVCFPIENKKLAQRILRNLDLYLNDNSQAWIMQSDGSYVRVTRGKDEPIIQAQAMLLLEAQTG
jgi:polyphosphate kinase